ncbi:hypothetical protein Poli38472_009558 [Pythium oligandrum]|uniref:Uncharacterized protein n=1 Tax=Pythium oligandrum TaxID=41045 RepID=A0A8K1CF49_PYTOL|nr:hypothetical protein Poli38472_009558 [Pythium oligandrum]|eukprot:TMW62065.1 hypothetical protein Poli38472_009558 [Pythium oligandrum]
MADNNTKTPSATEPQADYRVQAEGGANSIPEKAAAQQAKALDGASGEDNGGDRFDENGVRMGRWEIEYFGADPVPNLVMGFLLPCVTAAQVSHRLGGSYVTMLILWGVPYTISLLSGSISVGPLSIAGLGNIVGVVAGLIWMFTTWHLRDHVRRRFEIPGHMFTDFLCAWFCSCCALVQMATHVKSYKPHSCEFGPAAEVLPPYHAEGPPLHSLNIV